MITLSTISFIIITQFCMVFLVLFIIWFYKHRFVCKKLIDRNNMLESIQIKVLELEKIKTLSEIFDQELTYNREAIDDHFSDDKTHDIAETYEFRSSYLQLEKKWLLEENKNDNYWDEIYQQLKQLFMDAVILNKRFSDDGISGDLKKRTDETSSDDTDIEDDSTDLSSSDSSELN